ncbi:hypothetical protein B0H10DRAFT_587286 [Mycena sp. CBHHK59/15]|nr:hypothetical protein B0H10DRAFT_587286 [Mycena sp. CBHHK59/15]
MRTGCGHQRTALDNSVNALRIARPVTSRSGGGTFRMRSSELASFVPCALRRGASPRIVPSPLRGLASSAGHLRLSPPARYLRLSPPRGVCTCRPCAVSVPFAPISAVCTAHPRRRHLLRGGDGARRWGWIPRVWAGVSGARPARFGPFSIACHSPRDTCPSHVAYRGERGPTCPPASYPIVEHPIRPSPHLGGVPVQSASRCPSPRCTEGAQPPLTAGGQARVDCAISRALARASRVHASARSPVLRRPTFAQGEGLLPPAPFQPAVERPIHLLRCLPVRPWSISLSTTRRPQRRSWARPPRSSADDLHGRCSRNRICAMRSRITKHTSSVFASGSATSALQSPRGMSTSHCVPRRRRHVTRARVARACMWRGACV